MKSPPLPFWPFLEGHVTTVCGAATSNQIRDKNNEDQSGQCNSNCDWDNVGCGASITVFSC